MKDKIADILKEYTKKKGISASFVILESYAEELVKNGCVIQDTNSVEVVRCKECGSRTSESIEKLQKQIAEKNAEIERLKAIEESHREQNGELRKEVEFMRQYIHDQGLEFDLLSKYNKSNKKIRTTNWLTKDMSAEKIAEKKAKAIVECNAEIRAEARAEAIKEFAERLKDGVLGISFHQFKPWSVHKRIDQIAKEMGVCGMSGVELFGMVSVPLYFILIWLVRIYNLLEKMAENTKKEGEQK